MYLRLDLSSFDIVLCAQHAYKGKIPQQQNSSEDRNYLCEIRTVAHAVFVTIQCKILHSLHSLLQYNLMEDNISILMCD